MLSSGRGEEHLLLRLKKSSDCIDTAICTLFLSSPRVCFADRRFIIATFEDKTLRQRSVGVSASQADELSDLARLLAGLWETARRLPEGSERQNAFMQIASFERRVAAFAKRAT
jgi:hypothetical protein